MQVFAKSAQHTQSCVSCTSVCGAAGEHRTGDSCSLRSCEHKPVFRNRPACLLLHLLRPWGSSHSASCLGEVCTVEIWHQSSPKCRYKDKPSASETLFTDATVEGYQPSLSSSTGLLNLTSMTLGIKGSWNGPTISHETRVRGQAVMVPSTSGLLFMLVSSACNSPNVDLLRALPLKMLAHVS